MIKMEMSFLKELLNLMILIMEKEKNILMKGNMKVNFLMEKNMVKVY